MKVDFNILKLNDAQKKSLNDLATENNCSVVDCDDNFLTISGNKTMINYLYLQYYRYLFNQKRCEEGNSIIEINEVINKIEHNKMNNLCLLLIYEMSVVSYMRIYEELSTKNKVLIIQNLFHVYSNK